MNQAVVTIVTRNYLHYALSLAASCRRWQADADFFIVLVDALPTEPMPTDLPCIIPAWELGIESWSRFSFQYTAFELACALKPHALRAVLDRGYESAIYLDADISVFAPMNTVSSLLQSHSIALTPHLHQPLPEDGKLPGAHTFLNAGTYNGGLIACRNDEQGQAFLSWWMQRLRTDCVVDIAGGLFVDQKWLNLVPTIFSRTAIVALPTCNAGHWTLSNHTISGDYTAGFEIDGLPLESFHFSNFLPTNPYEFMRSQTRVSFSSCRALERLVRGYHNSLVEHGAGRFQGLKCAYDRLMDSTPIKPEWRELIRTGCSALEDINDPFDTMAEPDLVQLFQTHEHQAARTRVDWQLTSPSQREQLQRKRSRRNYWRHLRARVGLS